MPTTASSSARSRSRLATTSPTRSSISWSSSSSRTRDNAVRPSEGSVTVLLAQIRAHVLGHELTLVDPGTPNDGANAGEPT